MKVTTLNNGFRVRNDEIYLVVGVMTSLFSACVWTAIVLTMCVFCFITHFKEFLIDDSGISCSLFGKKSVTSWSEINDWGISYLGGKRSFGHYGMSTVCTLPRVSKERKTVTQKSLAAK